MKYRDILQFEPITDVIQLDKLGSDDYREDIIKSFVYPDYFVETIIPEIVRNLKFGERNQKGIQIIGNYGTGKSHLMSLVSLIAENGGYLEKVTNSKAKDVLAPIAGILMAGATASTTAGATVAAQTFSSTLLEAGVSPLAAAAMIHAGATVVDSLPHGSFFHATGGSVSMSISERMKLIPYEALIGLTSTIVSIAVYLIMG